MIIYLYLKTHNKTGLKYLGQTSNPDPHRYAGSGTYWKRHLGVHGPGWRPGMIKKKITLLT